MFMPGLAPDALGWSVHRDFTAAVEALGHRFELLTTTSLLRAPHATGQARRLPVGRIWRALSQPMRPILRTGSLVPAAAALAKHLRRAGGSIDVLHVEVAYPHGAAAALAVWASGWRGPLVVTPMGEDTLVLERARYGFRRYPVPRAVAWSTGRCAAQPMSGVSPPYWRSELPLSRLTHPDGSSPSTCLNARRRRPGTLTRSEPSIEGALGTRWMPTSGRRANRRFSRLADCILFKGIETLVRAMPSITDGVLLIAGPSLNVTPLGDTATHLPRVSKRAWRRRASAVGWGRVAGSLTRGAGGG